MANQPVPAFPTGNPWFKQEHKENIFGTKISARNGWEQLIPYGYGLLVYVPMLTTKVPLYHVPCCIGYHGTIYMADIPFESVHSFVLVGGV